MAHCANPCLFLSLAVFSVMVVVESGESTSLSPRGYFTKTGRPANRMSGNRRLWEMNLFTLWPARVRPPLRLLLSPPGPILSAPHPAIFSQECQPLLVRLERLLVLMVFGALGTSPWSIRELKHNPQIERASGPPLYIRTKIIMVIACILLDTFHSLMSSNLYASN